MTHRKLVAEALGTALLVFVGVGVATLSFGFKLAGSSVSAGVVATALAFGFVASGRMSLREGAQYWVAQFIGAMLGAVVLWAIFSGAPGYSRSAVGLGTNGWGPKVSMIGIGVGGAFATEVVLTFIFVTVVLVATSRVGSPGPAGLAIGVALTIVHLIGIPLTGTSVNPARSLAPAVIVGHKALSQVWLFIVAPLVGGALAALVYRYFVPSEPVAVPSAIAEGDVERTTGTP